MILFIIIAIILLDCTVLYAVYKQKETSAVKIAYSLLIIFLPIFGVTLYYIINFIIRKK